MTNEVTFLIFVLFKLVFHNGERQGPPPLGSLPALPEYVNFIMLFHFGIEKKWIRAYIVDQLEMGC